jgi:hypothetical protein
VRFVPGAIVAGVDVHRRRMTVDALDTVMGGVSRGQIESTPAAVEEWVVVFPGRAVHVAGGRRLRPQTAPGQGMIVESANGSSECHDSRTPVRRGHTPTLIVA